MKSMRLKEGNGEIKEKKFWKCEWPMISELRRERDL